MWILSAITDDVSTTLEKGINWRRKVLSEARVHAETVGIDTSKRTIPVEVDVMVTRLFLDESKLSYTCSLCTLPYEAPSIYESLVRKKLPLSVSWLSVHGIATFIIQWREVTDIINVYHPTVHIYYYTLRDDANGLYTNRNNVQFCRPVYCIYTNL